MEISNEKIERNKPMNEIPANLLYSPEELEKWLDDTSVPLSDDDIRAMSAYYDSESFKYEESLEKTMEKYK